MRNVLLNQNKTPQCWFWKNSPLCKIYIQVLSTIPSLQYPTLWGSWLIPHNEGLNLRSLSKRDEAKSKWKRSSYIFPHKAVFHKGSERFGDNLKKLIPHNVRFYIQIFYWTVWGIFFSIIIPSLWGIFKALSYVVRLFKKIPTMSSPQRKKSPQCRKNTHIHPHNVSHPNPNEMPRKC